MNQNMPPSVVLIPPGAKSVTFPRFTLEGYAESKFQIPEGAESHDIELDGQIVTIKRQSQEAYDEQIAKTAKYFQSEEFINTLAMLELERRRILGIPDEDLDKDLEKISKEQDAHA